MIEITRNALDPQPITASGRRDSNGAVVTFLGTTRRTSEGKTVLYLEYEAYEPMALKKLEVTSGAQSCCLHAIWLSLLWEDERVSFAEGD